MILIPSPDWINSPIHVSNITSPWLIYIVCISESRLDSSTPDIELDIPGYDTYHLDHTNKLGGGICTFAEQNLKAECLQHPSSIASSGLHQLWLRTQAGNCRPSLYVQSIGPVSINGLLWHWVMWCPNFCDANELGNLHLGRPTLQFVKLI